MFRYILKIESIKGESARKGYKDGIEIESFQLGFKAPHKRHEIVELSKSSYWPGVVSKEITLYKKYDKSVPPLLMSLTTGEKIEKATIYSFKEENKVYLTTELEGIMIRRTAIHLDKENIMASLSLTYEAITQTYTPGSQKIGIFEYIKKIVEELLKSEPVPPEPAEPEETEVCKQDVALEEAAEKGAPFVQDCEKQQ